MPPAAKTAPKRAAPTTSAAKSSPMPAAAKGKSAPKSASSATGQAVVPKAKGASKASPEQAAMLPKEVVSYTGSALDVPAGESLLAAVSVEQLAQLADSVDPEEQLPARMLMVYVGDKDHSWVNAQRSLRDGAALKREIAEMEGGSFVTRKSMECYDALGVLSPKMLEGKHPAAFALAVFVEAVIEAAKDKLGLRTKAPPEPAPGEEPPAWPLKIPVGGIPDALADAVKWRRTPLFVCSGKAHVVDTFFSYQVCGLVDAKWILSMVEIKKEQDVTQMRESLRAKLASAIKFGQPIHIAMSNSAVMLKSKYCDDDFFPEGLFKQDRWFDKAVYSRVLRECDLQDWPGAFPGRMRDDCASYAFITTDFDLEGAREYLPGVIPHFEDVAIIEIDPDSIDA